MKQISANITGSLIVNGTDVTETLVSSTTWSGSLSSRVTNLESFSSSINEYTASNNSRLNSIESLTGSYATTGSNQFSGSQFITGSLTITGQVIAQTLNVQQVTSSIVYSSGSNIFGNNIGNTHQFTGSVLVTGSANINGNFKVESPTAANAYIVSTGGDYDTNLYLGYTGVETQTYIKRLAGNLVLGTTNIDRLTIGFDGAATFSSSVTAASLSVIDGSLYPRITVQSTNAGSSAAGYNFADNSGVQWAIAYDKAGSGLQFFKEGSGNRFYITNGGNVGIGTTNGPASLLHIYNASGARFRIQSTASTFSLIDFYNDTTPRWSIGIDNTQSYGKLENRVLGIDAIRFYDSSNNLALNPSGGNVLIGTTVDNGHLLRVAGYTYSDYYRTLSGTTSLANNTATTLFTLSGNRALYIVYVSLPNGDTSPASYSAYAIIAWDTGAGRILQQTDGGNLFITLSGNNVQGRQTSGNTNNVEHRLIKIG